MTRLIDADVIDPRYVPIVPVITGSCIHYEWVVFAEDLEKMPTVDAVPVRHGRWLNKRYGVKFDGYSYPFRTIGTCSECHETSCDAGDYCPNCGADMREVKHETD